VSCCCCYSCGSAWRQVCGLHASACGQANAAVAVAAAAAAAAALTMVNGVAAAAAAAPSGGWFVVCMSTAVELTRVDGAAAAGLAGARGPQKSLSFLFLLIQAHLIQKIYSLIQRHRVLPKFYIWRTRNTRYFATLWCVALKLLKSDTKCLKATNRP